MNARLGLAGTLLALHGCGTRPVDPAPLPPATATTASAAAPGTDRLDAILAAEHQRSADGITAADQQSRDVGVRRAAARALARIGGDAARAGLLRALADEDDEALAWGAYGLGFSCKGHEKDTTAALVARALARFEGPATSSLPSPSRLDAGAAIARAIGRCGSEESEPTLVAWLAGPTPRALVAAYALGDMAVSKQKLREETLAALLNLAAGSAAAPAMPEALFPVSRLDHVPLTVVDRIFEVASARLAEPGDARLFAVRALGRGGNDAAVKLELVLTSPGTFTAAERAEAARALKRLGKGGQRSLASALPKLVPSADPIALTGLVGDEIGVLLTVLDGIEAPTVARKALVELAALPLPPGAPASIARRIAWIRCGAAKILAGEDARDKVLAACDVTPRDVGSPAGSGSIGARALVEVLGRGEITGARLVDFLAIARGTDVLAREAALELLETHEEIDSSGSLLTEALGAKESGVVAKAAEVIAKQPQRAGADPPPKTPRRSRRRRGAKTDVAAPTVDLLAPSPPLVEALLTLLARPATEADPELIATIIDAAGALALKDAKPRLDELCRSPYPTTREHAAKALGMLGSEKKVCELPPGGGPAPAELDHLARAKVTLSFDTDAGALTLTLDPTFAPVAVTRIVDLARAGYYEGKIVHRVVPGFVTQFGSPFGDDVGGPEGKPAIRCETSPLPFAPLTVGVALAGRDTGTSQLFVMHGRYPHLDGNYALVGSATGPWSSFIDGDVIRHVVVSP